MPRVCGLVPSARSDSGLLCLPNENDRAGWLSRPRGGLDGDRERVGGREGGRRRDDRHEPGLIDAEEAGRERRGARTGRHGPQLEHAISVDRRQVAGVHEQQPARRAPVDLRGRGQQIALPFQLNADDVWRAENAQRLRHRRGFLPRRHELRAKPIGLRRRFRRDLLDRAQLRSQRPRVDADADRRREARRGREPGERRRRARRRRAHDRHRRRLRRHFSRHLRLRLPGRARDRPRFQIPGRSDSFDRHGQSCRHTAQLRQLGRALRAGREVRFERTTLVRVERAERVGRHRLFEECVCHAESTRRSDATAVRKRVLTVPSGTPVCPAISECVSP